MTNTNETTLGTLKRGDVLRLAKPFPDENPTALYVVKRAEAHRAFLIPLSCVGMVFPSCNPYPAEELVIKVHDVAEVERAARFLGLV